MNHMAKGGPPTKGGIQWVGFVSVEISAVIMCTKRGRTNSGGGEEAGTTKKWGKGTTISTGHEGRQMSMCDGTPTHYHGN